MGDIHHDDLEVLVGGVLANPVRVEDSEASQSTTNTFLSDGLEVSLWLLLFDGTGALWFTIGTSLGNWPFSSTSSHGNTVDDESLLSLVTKSSCLVWSSWAGSSMNL